MLHRRYYYCWYSSLLPLEFYGIYFEVGPSFIFFQHTSFPFPNFAPFLLWELVTLLHRFLFFLMHFKLEITGTCASGATRPEPQAPPEVEDPGRIRRH